MLDIEHHRALLRQCSIAAALEAVGERWAFLILRGAFNGLHHFEEFQSTLGIARNILSNRLAKLVEHGILAREPDPVDRRKIAYRLTDKGRTADMPARPKLTVRAAFDPKRGRTVKASRTTRLAAAR